MSSFKIGNLLPIGFVFISTVNINPSKWYGGTWEYIGAGMTLVGVDLSQTEFNQVKKTGGEKTHKLTINEMPNHNHKTPILFGGSETLDGYDSYKYTSTARFYNLTSSVGGNQPHNNLPPYICVYMWERTA